MLATANHRSIGLLTVVVVLLAVFLFLSRGGGKFSTTTYTKGDALTLWMDTVGPFNNPQERYPFTKIPYCHPRQNPKWNQLKSSTTFLGEKIVGSELRNSGLDIRFQEGTSLQCTTQPLTNQDLVTFIKFLRGGDNFLNYSTYKMYLEDFPLFGMIGSEHFTEEEIELKDFPSYRRSKVIYKVYTTQTVIVQTHQNSILHARLVGEPSSMMELKEGGVYTFQIKVVFRESGREDEPEERMMQDYADEFLNYTRRISVAIGCSTLTVLALLTRRAKRAISKKNDVGGTNKMLNVGLLSDQNQSQAQDSNMVGEPEHVHLFAAFVGAGTQLLFVTLVAYYQLWRHGPAVFNHAAILDTIWGSMVLSSLLGGYVVTHIVRVYGEPKMLRLFELEVELFQDELQLIPDDEISTDNESELMMIDATKSDNKVLTSEILRTSLIIIAISLPVAHTTILFWLSIFSWVKGTTRAVSISTFFQLYWSWALIAVPLYSFGTAISRRERIPRKTNAHGQEPVRPVLFQKQWLTRTPVLVMISGLITFLPLCIEELSILASALDCETYKATPSLFALFVIVALILNVASRSVVSLFLASGYQNRWHWIAFACGASTGVYVCFIGAFYFFIFSSMSGWYQQVYYWLVTVGISADVALVFGALSFWSGHLMVRSLSQQKSV